MAPASRVMHIISSLSHGGAEKLALELAKLQVQKGMSVSIAYINSAENGFGNPETESNFQELCSSLGISTFPLDEKSYFSYWVTRTVNLRKAIRTANPEILHVHLGRGLMLMLLGNVRIPAVMTIHSVNVGFPNILFKVFKLLRIKYVAVGTAIKEIFEPLIQAPVDVIFNGIDLRKFPHRAIPQNQTSEPFQFVAVGRVLPPKNYPMLIDAVKNLVRMPDALSTKWIVNVAGDGPLLDEMRNLVKSSGMSEHINFLGGCNDVPAFLKNADVFIMTSHYEGMPMAMLEAMSTGLPIVSTDFQGISDVVIHEDSALISEVDDAVAFAENMLRIMQSESLRTSIAKRAQLNSNNFSIERTNEKYMNLYSELRSVKK